MKLKKIIANVIGIILVLWAVIAIIVVSNDVKDMKNSVKECYGERLCEIDNENILYEAESKRLDNVIYIILLFLSSGVCFLIANVSKKEEDETIPINDEIQKTILENIIPKESKCPYCGRKINPRTNRCSSCGYRE